MNRFLKVLSVFLCALIISSVFTNVGFAGLFHEGSYSLQDAFDMLNRNNPAPDDEFDNDDRTVYEAFDVPEPPLWRSILFLPESLMLFFIIYVLMPGAYYS